MASSKIRYTVMFEDLEKELEDLDNIFDNSETLKNFSNPEENGNFNFFVKIDPNQYGSAVLLPYFCLLFLFIVH